LSCKIIRTEGQKESHAPDRTQRDVIS
jgi:hypothetical protein